MTVGQTLEEPLRFHRITDDPAARVPHPARHRRPRRRRRRPLPARVLRRPAPARRHRPRARHPAGLHRRRRADLRPRRQHPGPDHQSAHGPQGRVRPHLHVHRPRPRGGAPHQRSRHGAPPRQGRRTRPRRRPVRRTPAPLHALSDLRDSRAGRRPRARAQAHGARRRGGQRRRPAQRLPLPHPMPARASRSAPSWSPCRVEHRPGHFAACHFAGAGGTG